MKYSMHMSALWTTTKLHLRQSFICHVLLSPFCLKQLILHQCCQPSEFEMYRWLDWTQHDDEAIPRAQIQAPR